MSAAQYIDVVTDYLFCCSFLGESIRRHQQQHQASFTTHIYILALVRVAALARVVFHPGSCYGFPKLSTPRPPVICL